MTISKIELTNLFDETLLTFFKKERDNIINNTNERNLCSRFSIYMEDIKIKYGFDNYYCDTEYNRKQNGQVKTIINDNMEIININCDIILHSRGHIIKYDNLIAIEMKKSNRPKQEKVDDKNRLIALTKESYDGIRSNDGTTQPEHVCGYLLGIYIELNIQSSICLLEFYHKGKKTGKKEIQF